MTARRRRPDLRLSLAVIAGALAVSLPTGRALGALLVFGDRDIEAGLARHWVAAPGLLLVVLSAVAVARLPRLAARVIVPVLILALLGWGAWQGVGARIDAWREGPLNAAL